MSAVKSPDSVRGALKSLGARHLFKNDNVEAFLIKRSFFRFLFRSNWEGRCIALLNELRANLPAVFLWIDVNNNASRLIESTETISSERVVGRLRQDVKFEDILSSGNNSGWVLLYFSEPNAQVPKGLELLPVDPKGLEHLADRCDIDAMIISWCDDTEWAFVCRPV